MSPLPTLSAVRITTARTLLRKAHDADRERLIELQTDPRAWTHLGGPRTRQAVEQRLAEIGGPANATSTPGAFVIADKPTDNLIGVLDVKRRPADKPGHLTEGGEELELGYLLHPDHWGAGLAFEAITATLRTAADELPDQPVLIVTQTANERSLKLATRLGFQTVTTFRHYDADQTLATATLHTFKTPC